METEPKLLIDKKEGIPNMVNIVDNINNTMEKLLIKKFLAKENIVYSDVEKIINEGLPQLDENDSDYPENRDDRVAILRQGIEALVKSFNEYKDEFESLGEFEKYEQSKGEITNRAEDMLKYFIKFFSDNYLNKLEK